MKLQMISKSAKTSSKSINNKFNNNPSIIYPNKSIILLPYKLGSLISKKYYFHTISSYSIKSPFFLIYLINLLNLHKISPHTQEGSIILILKTGKSIQWREKLNLSTNKRKKARIKLSLGLSKSFLPQVLSWESVFRHLSWNLNLFYSHMLKLLEQLQFYLIAWSIQFKEWRNLSVLFIRFQLFLQTWLNHSIHL